MLDHAKINTIFIEDMQVGQVRGVEKCITGRSIETFAEVSLDRNPVHVDETAAGTIFRAADRPRHAHRRADLGGVGEQLPGHGAVYLAQNLSFRAPVHLGDTVRAEVEVLEIDHPRRRVRLATRCLVGETLVLDGEALVLAPSRTT